MNNWLDAIPKEYALFWVIMLFIVIYMLIKYIPKIWKVFNTMRKHINTLESIAAQVEQNKRDVEEIQSRFNRECTILALIERAQEQQYKYLEDSLDERELILRSLLGVVQGLQEIGANGPTKRAEKDIQEFLLKKYHQPPIEKEVIVEDAD